MRGRAAVETAEWHVVVVDEAGRVLEGAQLVAVRAGGRLEGFGSTTWLDAEPGVWTLIVRSEGLPVWRDEVEVASGERTTTRIQLGQGIRVDGSVQDQGGVHCAGYIVGFVPDGGAAPTVPSRWLEFPHTRTRGDGQFTALLPEGTYRLFVGYGGKVLFEESSARALAIGRPERVDVTLPSPTRLLIEVSDPPGHVRESAHGVTVYREATLLALDRPPRPRGSTESLGRASREVDFQADAETAAEHAAADDRIERATEESNSVEAQRARALREAVVPEGWAKARSGFCSVEGRLLLERMPVHEELRFAVYRAPEAFRVEGSAFLEPGSRTVVRLTLPPALPADAPPRTEPRTVVAEIESIAPPDSEAEVGAVWR
ncbi:MAG: carboxypeptidase-like regulatory domain-containing protein [Planctomycetota bacterium]